MSEAAQAEGKRLYWIGVVLVVAGVLACLAPLITAFFIAMTVGAVFTAVGVLEMFAWFQLAERKGHGWQMVQGVLFTLAGLTIPALLVWQFQVSFPNILALVPFIPVIGAMGGNVGSQSSTIVVRGFATGRVDFQNLGSFLFRELIISSLMGVACGVLSGVVAIVWHGDPMLSLTVTISMMIAIVASAILGVLIPYIFRVINIDPAIAAGPLVTKIDDIVAIGIYYIAALVLLGN